MKSRYLSYLLVSLIAFFSVISVLLPFIEFNVNFETIDFGFWCANSERGDYIIRTQQEWDDLCQKTCRSSSEAPDIDFSSNVVLAVFMGEQPTDGFRIEITKIGENGAERRIYIRETIPGGLLAAIISYPYHIVKLHRIPKPIVFIHTLEDYS